MAKLYPPLIEGVLPAFYLEYDGSNSFYKGAAITIPFTMNKSVSEIEVHGFSLRLRTVASGSYIFEPIYSNAYSLTKGTVTFSLTANQCKKLVEGQYYKAQIAYCGSRVINSKGIAQGTDIGYYSTVGVIKCTSMPKVSIKGMASSSINFLTNEYFGLYDLTHCKDQTEKVYSFEFTVYDDKDEIYYTTGECLHLTYQDTEYTTSIDRISMNDFASDGSVYAILYKVTTLNGLVVNSPKYKVTSGYLVSSNLAITIHPESNEEEGYIDVHFRGALDKTQSFYYILNDEAFNVVETIESGAYQGQIYNIYNLHAPITEYVRSVIENRLDRDTYLRKYSLFRFYPYGRPDEDKAFQYTFLSNDMPRKMLIDDYYYDDYLVDALYNAYLNGRITKEELDLKIYDGRVPCYKMIVKGTDAIRRYSVELIEAKYIDINDGDVFVLDYTEKEVPYYGGYLLSRASDEDGYKTWYNLYRFKWYKDYPSEHSFRDYTAEHGRRYKYALLQYNVWGLYSARIESEAYMATFEDAYLWDGKKTLRIKYNPEVSSFKTNVLELKSDTLGGKFPFITRNGSTYYKEFPIGGLLAAEIDEKNTFINPESIEWHRHSTPDDDFIAPTNAYRDYHIFSVENIALEKNFKMNVLAWLNDGKPKMFKSPYEGNYIVRLLNVSLSPVNELGRLLHSFSSTAYEIADYSYENLVAFGFLNVNYPSDYLSLWRSYNLAEERIDGDIVINFERGVHSFTIQDMMPGDKIYLTLADLPEELEIMIGVTGSYTYEEIGADVVCIRIPLRANTSDPDQYNSRLTGTITCFYEGMTITAFDSIVSMQLKTIVGQQFVGVSPWALYLKYDDSWLIQTNDGLYSFALDESAVQELFNYNVRDFLDDSLIIRKTPQGRTYMLNYAINADLLKLIKSFDPNEILDRINLSINKGDVYKVKLVNIEMLRFSLRPCIPVYTQVPYTKDASGYVINGLFENPTKEIPYNSNNKYLYVSTSPYGYPHPIEELALIEMLDPFCIFKVLRLYRGAQGQDERWVPINNFEAESYYDPYYRTWLREPYDPTVKMNYKWKRVAMLEGYSSKEEAIARDGSLELWEDPNTFKLNLRLKETSIPDDEYHILKRSPILANLINDQKYLMLKPVSRLLYRESVLYWEELRKADRGEAHDEIKNDRMFNYRMFKGAGANKYYYSPFDNDIVTLIDDARYELYDRVVDVEGNVNYFVIGSKTIGYNEVYWYKEYETVLNFTTEKQSSFELTNLKDVNSIHLGNGVMAEMTYQIRVVDYYTEIADEDVAEAKLAYLYEKEFYSTLMETYNAISQADLDRSKDNALSHLYFDLLYNKEKHLSTKDITILKQLLNNNLSKQELELLTLYSVERLNTGLTSNILTEIVEYKKLPKNLSVYRYNIDKLKLYKIIESDGVEIIILIDTSDVNFRFFDVEKINNKYVAKVGNENRVFDIENKHDDLKTLFRMKDANSGKTYTYIVDPTNLYLLYKNEHGNVLLEDLSILFIAPLYDRENNLIEGTNTILVIDTTTIPNTDGGGLIELYNYAGNIELTTTNLRLLDDELVAQVQIDPYFIDIIPFTANNKKLWEEQEIRNVLSTSDEFLKIKGVIDKDLAIKNEIKNLENEIELLNNIKLSGNLTYITLYNTLVNNKNSYNNNLAKVLCNYVIAEYLAQCNTVAEKTAAKQKLMKIFGSTTQEVLEILTDSEEEAKRFYDSAKGLYQAILLNIPKINAYRRMIEENTGDNIGSDVNQYTPLDEYLEELIKLISCSTAVYFMGFYDACEQYNGLFNDKISDNNTISNEKKAKYKSLLEEISILYNKTWEDMVNTEALIKLDYIESSTNYSSLVTDYINYYKRQYDNLKNITIADGVYYPSVSMSDWANITIYANDLEATRTYVNKIYDDLPLLSLGQDVKLKGFTIDPITIELVGRINLDNYKSPIDLEDGPGYYLVNLTEKEAIKDFNDKVNRKIYHWRDLLVYVADEQNDIKYYIFNPFSKEYNIEEKTYQKYTTDLLDTNKDAYRFILEIHNLLKTTGLALLQSDDTIFSTSTLIRAINSLNTQRANVIYVLDENNYDSSHLNKFNAELNKAKNYFNVIENGIERAKDNAALIKLFGVDSNLILNKLNNFSVLSLSFIEEKLQIALIYTDTSVDPNNRFPDFICIKLDDLVISTEVIMGDQGDYELADSGIYYEYLKDLTLKRIDKLVALLLEAMALRDLYLTQEDNYLYKYDKYSTAAEEAQKTYETFFGTEAFEFYNNVNNPNREVPLTPTEKEAILTDYRNRVKKAWWKFLALLDAKYSLEKKRGMYR